MSEESVNTANETQAVEPEQTQSFSALRWIITGILWLIVAIPAAGSIIGFTGGNWWMNVLSNFRIQYALIFLIMLVITLLMRRWLLSIVCLILLVLNFLPIVPTFNSNVVAPVAQDAQIKMLLMNVAHRYNEEQYQPAADLVMDEKPNLILIQETNEGWLGKFYDLIRDDYDLVTQEPRADHYGIAMLVGKGDHGVEVVKSKTEKASEPVTDYNQRHYLLQIPQIEAVIKAPDSEQEIYFYGIRTRPPMHESLSNATEFIIEKAISRLNDQGNMPKVVLGDLNHTVWSPYVQKLMNEAGLEPMSGAYGLMPTYPASWPWPLRVPIDMILFNDQINLYEARLGPDINSTHLPLIVTIGPRTHMQRKSQSGVSGIMRSVEQQVEDTIENVQSATANDTP